MSSCCMLELRIFKSPKLIEPRNVPRMGWFLFMQRHRNNEYDKVLIMYGELEVAMAYLWHPGIHFLSEDNQYKAWVVYPVLS